jgi:hypothetical protein
MRLATKTLRTVLLREETGGSEPNSSPAEDLSMIVTVIRPRNKEVFEADVNIIESMMHIAADFEELKDAFRGLHQS